MVELLPLIGQVNQDSLLGYGEEIISILIMYIILVTSEWHMQQVQEVQTH